MRPTRDEAIVMFENDKWSEWDVSSGMVDPTIRLIHPLSTEFHVHGDEESHCQQWAVARKLMLVGGVARCAHGLYAMGTCPGDCEYTIGLDHTTVWAETDGLTDPFLLTQPYVNKIPQEMIRYADHHGLDVRVSEGDGWYGHGSLPILFGININGQSAWPLTAKLAQFLALYPPLWKGAEDVLDGARRTS